MTGLENSLQGDTVGWLVGMLLLIMSVASWVLILWKSWLLLRASRDISRSTAAFWQSASLADAGQRLQAFDRESLVLPLIDATRLSASATRSHQHVGAGVPKAAIAARPSRPRRVPVRPQRSAVPRRQVRRTSHRPARVSRPRAAVARLAPACRVAPVHPADACPRPHVA